MEKQKHHYEVIDGIVDTLVSLFPSGAGLHEPWFCGDEIELVSECIRSTFVSSVGEFVDRFEKAVRDYTGSAYAVAVVNGTSALHVSLLLAGIEENDEVLIPALTFVATANAVLYCRAIPHFVDSDSEAFGIDLQKLESYLSDIGQVRGDRCWNRKTNRPIRAIVPMHTFGHSVDLTCLLELADRWKLVVVEDAAESLGSFYKDRHTGTWGKLGAISFNGNKIITAGGGGVILTQERELAQRARHLTTTAKKPHPWEFIHDEMGFNNRMPNINAALACAQIKQLPLFLDAKRKLAEKYGRAFGGVPGVRFVREPSFGRSNYWLNSIQLNDNLSYLRDVIIDKCHANRIMVRPAWNLLPELKFLDEYPKMPLETANQVRGAIICLPSSAFLYNRLASKD
ncbi:MAG: LegC family aminotransferase [Bdellovibrionales bacterium]|nr:LegC family aminotransferase [Bdellovibrionales bacterium]